MCLQCKARLPSRQLAAVIQRLSVGEPGGVLVVCARAGIDDRRHRFWRDGIRPVLKPSLAERALEALDLFYWDVWNADTVRVPLVRAHLYLPRVYRRRRTSERVLCWDRGIRDYGDGGPDYAELERIAGIFEPVLEVAA